MRLIIKSCIVLSLLQLYCSESMAQSDSNEVKIELYKLVSGSYDLYDDVFCRMVRGGNAGFDNRDVGKLTQFDENVSVFRSGRDFGLETRPLVNCTDTVQLRIYRTNVATYRFVIDMKPYPITPGLSAVLQDVFLNTERVVKFGDTTHINFSVSSNTASTGLRFRIVFRRTQVTTAPFAQISTICRGEAINLPSTSSNGINGTWTPAVNNTATTTYTFNPSEGQCATSPTMTVEVNQPVTPVFDPVGPFDSGTTFSLPTTSNNGITGNWSPDINNTQTTTYTFTPGSGQCAVAVQQTVTINPVITSLSDFQLANTITLYPNPVMRGGVMNLSIKDMSPGDYLVTTFSVNGMKVKEQSLRHFGGSAVYTLAPDPRLGNGRYVIKVTEKTGGKSLIINLLIK
jgi:hypothetical protein